MRSTSSAGIEEDVAGTHGDGRWTTMAIHSGVRHCHARGHGSGRGKGRRQLSLFATSRGVIPLLPVVPSSGLIIPVRIALRSRQEALSSLQSLLSSR